jgi:hypothetical protein
MAKNEATLLVRIKESGGEILDKISGGLSSLVSASKYVGAALIGFGAAAVASFRDSEIATNALNQAMVQQGVYTADLAKKYGEMASKLEGLTTFADEQITSAQATLQSYIGQREVTEQLTKATLDFATAKKIDLKAASEAIGKAVSGETNALSRYGIEVDTSADKATRMAQAIQGLNNKFGGQAEAAAQGLGTLEQLKNALDNVMEKVGERLAPFIAFFTTQLRDFSTALQNNKDFVTGLDTAIIIISKSFAVLKNMVVGTAEVIGVGLGGAVEAVSLAMQGKFAQAKEVVKLGLDEIGNVTKERTLTLGEELNAIDDARAIADEQKRQNELAMIQAAQDRKGEIQRQGNLSQFTEAQKQAAKMYGIELKTKDDLKKLDDAKVKDRSSFLSQIATLESSNNKALAALGKAAAIAQITIQTGEAAMSGYRWGMAIGGPGLASAFQCLAIAAGAAQIARVSGVQLAEGGIVKATPGGINATIGEGGRDEAVIPLDDPDAQARLGGGGTTVIFNGPVLGDESQAMEFARAIDKNLLKLRQTNQSVAFEEDIF